MGHRPGLWHSRVALDGVAVDKDCSPDVDALELDEQPLSLPLVGDMEHMAIPDLAPPATLAGGGVEIGVLLVVAVGDAHHLPLRVVERGGEVVAVGMVGAHRMHLQLAQLRLHGMSVARQTSVDGDTQVAECRRCGENGRPAHHHPGIAHCIVDRGDVVLIIGLAGQGGSALSQSRPLPAVVAHLDAGQHLAHRVATKNQFDAAGLLRLEQVQLQRLVAGVARVEPTVIGLGNPPIAAAHIQSCGQAG